MMRREPVETKTKERPGWARFVVPGMLVVALAIGGGPALASGTRRNPAGRVQLKLGTWYRIGPFRDQGPMLNWMDNVESSFRHQFDVEKYAMARGGQASLGKPYPSPNFPATPKAVRQWTKHPEWIDGYCQQLPRGPSPSAGESQFVYRTIAARRPTEIELDFILRAPESDRRMGGKGMEYWRRTGRYWWSMNGKEMVRWDGKGDMPRASRGKVTLRAGVNHFLAKVTNNRHAYGFAFSIKGLHPELRHEVGFERMWRPHIKDLATEWPYHVEGNRPRPNFSRDQLYKEGLRRLRALKFHPEPMPGVESAARDSKGRIVPAMEKALEKYPVSRAGGRHTARLKKLGETVKPLLKRIDTTGQPMTDEVLKAVGALEELWEAAIKELPPLVYLERPTYVYDSMMYEGAGAGDAVIKSFNPVTKDVKTVFDCRGKAKANEISLSWDGRTIFIGGGNTVSAVNSDGTNFRRITEGQSPVQMPDGRIVFFSKDVGQAPCKAGGPRRLLFICDPDGSNRKVVSANTCIDTAPTVMNDGRIIFTRWDYGVNKNVFNRHALWTQNPDGSGMDLYFGNTVIDPRALCRPHQVPGRPEILTIFGPHHSKLTGLLGLVWNGAGKEAKDGLGFRRITHDTGSVGDQPQPWSYQDPYPLNEQLFLVSYGGRRHRTAALYLYDRSGNRKCVLETSNAKRGVHTARPFVARRRPPIIPNRSRAPNWKPREDLHARLLSDPDWNQKGRLILQDVYLGLEPEIERGRIKYLAVMEQPTQSHGRGGAIGVGTIWFVNRLVGTVPVEKDGSAHFEVPALRSIYFHALDKDGMMLMTQGSDFHVMPGEVRSCVGCHEQRKGITAPPEGRQMPIASMKSPVRPKMPDWGTRGIIEYAAVVQPVFDKYCIKCHGGLNPKSRLDLTGDETTAYNMSYMQLVDRRLVHYTPGTGSTHAQPTNDYDEQAPLSRGAILSKLTKNLRDPKHSKKKIPMDDQFRVTIWIDSNVPYYSHYRQLPPSLLKGDAQKHLKQVHGRRCASCHNPGRFMPDEKSGLNRHHIGRHVGGLAGQWGIAPSGMRVRHLNLTNPSHSAALQAPLSKTAGGWGLCRTGGDDPKTGARGASRMGTPVFADKNDPDYKKMLTALKNGVARRNDISAKGLSQLLREGNKR
ncbi:MAG: HzsA-related protein [Planctomycetota bacterium]